MLDLSAILNISDDDLDTPQMGLTGRQYAALKARGFVNKDGKEAHPSVIKRNRKESRIKGDVKLSEIKPKTFQELSQELKEVRNNIKQASEKGDQNLVNSLSETKIKLSKELNVQQQKRDGFESRLYEVNKAPVGIRPTPKQYANLLDSMDYNRLNEYESKSKGNISKRYKQGAKQAKKRIESNISEINLAYSKIKELESRSEKVSNKSANLYAKQSVKRRNADNPQGLSGDGQNNANHKASKDRRETTIKIDELKNSIIQLERKNSRLQTAWGNAITVADRDRTIETPLIKPSIQSKVKRETTEDSAFIPLAKNAGIRPKKLTARELIASKQKKRFDNPINKMLTRTRLGSQFAIVGKKYTRKAKPVKNMSDVNRDMERKGQMKLF